MTFARHDIAKLVGATITVAALGLTTPGIASADAVDQAFLSKLFADAVLFAGADVVIPKAREACDEFDAGMSPASIHEKLVFNSAFVPRQAAISMADAVQAYCPRHAAEFMEPAPV